MRWEADLAAVTPTIILHALGLFDRQTAEGQLARKGRAIISGVQNNYRYVMSALQRWNCMRRKAKAKREDASLGRTIRGIR
jgi:hypothetical protein